MDDEPKRPSLTAEQADAKLESVFERTVTPQPYRLKRDTQEIVKAQQGAERRMSDALGVPALTLAGRVQLQQEISDAETRCEERHTEYIKDLWADIMKKRALLEKTQRDASAQIFDLETQLRDKETKIESLQRQLDAAIERSRREKK